MCLQNWITLSLLKSPIFLFSMIHFWVATHILRTTFLHERAFLKYFLKIEAYMKEISLFCDETRNPCNNNNLKRKLPNFNIHGNRWTEIYFISKSTQWKARNVSVKRMSEIWSFNYWTQSWRNEESWHQNKFKDLKTNNFNFCLHKIGSLGSTLFCK